MQLAKEIGVRQGTAWFILQRLREACGAQQPRLKGVVEADETYFTGKESSLQGILLGRHGTLTLRCVRCVYAISALKAGVPNDAVQLHETYSFVLTANTAKGTDVKTGCIVKFSTTQSERHAITLKVNSL